MGIGEAYQEWGLLKKKVWAYSGVAATKGQVVDKQSDGTFKYCDEGDEGFFGVAATTVASDAADRELQIFADGVVEIAIVSGFPIYLGDTIVSAAAGCGRKVSDYTSVTEREFIGTAMNADVLSASGNVPVKLAGW